MKLLAVIFFAVMTCIAAMNNLPLSLAFLLAFTFLAVIS